jgi:hypothetical protein
MKYVSVECCVRTTDLKRVRMDIQASRQEGGNLVDLQRPKGCEKSNTYSEILSQTIQLYPIRCSAAHSLSTPRKCQGNKEFTPC